MTRLTKVSTLCVSPASEPAPSPAARRGEREGLKSSDAAVVERVRAREEDHPPAVLLGHAPVPDMPQRHEADGAVAQTAPRTTGLHLFPIGRRLLPVAQRRSQRRNSRHALLKQSVDLARPRESAPLDAVAVRPEPRDAKVAPPARQHGVHSCAEGSAVLLAGAAGAGSGLDGGHALVQKEIVARLMGPRLVALLPADGATARARVPLPGAEAVTVENVAARQQHLLLAAEGAKANGAARGFAATARASER
mmetsp:Transcript_17536/g.51888  ORF Transcript_17536/g.51888 Transcript_17536/m.51888 type:complete len:251 (+) Transcript_17536:521-1273(+)